jgi:hypothetical protein
VPWVRLDDQFHTNSKAVIAGLEGRALYLAGLCWCARNLTDGNIDKRALPTVAALAGVEPNVADTLVAVGLWEQRDDSYLVPDFLDYNPSRDQVIAEREAAAERQRKSRASRRDSHRDSGRGHAVSSPAPVPIPDSNPVSSRPGNSQANGAHPDDETAATGATAATAVPDDVWTAYADLKLAQQTNVRNAGPWKTRTAANARVELADQAARWWHMFELTPRRLAEALVDGNAPRNVPYRKDTP